MEIKQKNKMIKSKGTKNLQQKKLNIRKLIL